MTYVYSLLGLVTLCALWAAFQLWLTTQDPETAERANKCGGCNGQCKS